MLASLRSRLAQAARIVIVSTVLTAAALAVAQPAAAADYCVSPKVTCAHNVADLQTALNEAAAAPDSDRIFLGATTYGSPDATGFVYHRADGPVELIGAGRGSTILTNVASFGPQNVLKVIGGASTSIHDLTIQLPPSVATDADGLETNGTAKQIDVFDNASQSNIRTAVRFIGGGALEDSMVTLFSAQATIGVLCVTGACSVADSIITADRAVQIQDSGSIVRSYLNGTHEGVLISAGKATVGESLIRVSSPSGTGIFVETQSAPGTTVDARNLTLSSLVAATGIAALTAPTPAPIAITLTNSIMRGYTHPLDLYSFSGAPVTATSSYSDYDSAATHTNGPGATITSSHISYVTDPGFVNPFSGDLRLASNSPLVDAGDPATPQATDLDGNPLVTDGNNDGTARRDIGAFEHAGALPTAPPSGGGGDQPPSGGSQAPVTAPDSRTTPAADTQAPSITGFSSSRKVFRVARAGTAIAALARGTMLRYTLSEAAKVTIKIQRVHTRRGGGTLTRRGTKGANAIKFSGRIGARALTAGRYTATISAVDAAGNHSAKKTISFRIAR